MEKILTKDFALRHLSVYGAIIVMFTYSFLLDRDFACTCEPQVSDCVLYMALPVIMIFILVLWMDKSFHRVCRYTCPSLFHGRCCSDRKNKCTYRLCSCFTRQIIQSGCVGLLWVAFVYLDGDWYVCCQNDRSEQQAHLACKDKKSITEADRVLIAELKNHSRVIGSFLLFGLICLVALVSVISWSKCCRKDLYYKVILEEEQNVLDEALRKSAKTKLSEEVNKKISAELWEDCLDFANNLIKSEAAAVRDNKATAGTEAEAAERAAEAAKRAAEAAARAETAKAAARVAAAAIATETAAGNAARAAAAIAAAAIATEAAAETARAAAAAAVKAEIKAAKAAKTARRRAVEEAEGAREAARIEAVIAEKEKARAREAAEEAEAAAEEAERAAGPAAATGPGAAGPAAATGPELQQQEVNKDQGADAEGPQGMKMKIMSHPSATKQITM